MTPEECARKILTQQGQNVSEAYIADAADWIQQCVDDQAAKLREWLTFIADAATEYKAATCSDVWAWGPAKLQTAINAARLHAKPLAARKAKENGVG